MFLILFLFKIFVISEIFCFEVRNFYVNCLINIVKNILWLICCFQILGVIILGKKGDVICKFLIVLNFENCLLIKKMLYFFLLVQYVFIKVEYEMNFVNIKMRDYNIFDLKDIFRVILISFLIFD